MKFIKEIKMKLIAFILSISIFVSGCASSVAVPVPVAQVGDDTKSCDAIANEMQGMVTAQVEAEGNKDKQIGTNAALGVTGIFLLGIPWFFMDLGGAATAEQKAAKARYDRLQQMQVDRKCPATPAPITAEQPVVDGTPIAVTATSVQAQKTSVQTQKTNELSPATRLEELNALLKKGLITQNEFNTKRAQILNSM
jgi:dihydroxyacetone kinase DhaKLM complex PTS-EIIA-like component DhaM